MKICVALGSGVAGLSAIAGMVAIGFGVWVAVTELPSADWVWDIDAMTVSTMDVDSAFTSTVDSGSA